MVGFSNCKINIGLNITGKRDDGYHNLETIFYPLAIKDAIEIMVDENSSTDVSFVASGNSIDVAADDNICVKAYRLLKQQYPQISPIKMHLHKTIPTGAGLGGGSANASKVLLMLNEIFALQLTENTLQNLALQLGSDCPFFIFNKPCFASGRGEILTPIAIDLSAYNIMLINPGFHINTKLAFQSLSKTSFSPENILLQQIKEPIATWKNTIKNDFEKPVFKQQPAIAEIKEYLYKNGAIYSAMSGSGSSVYGIFEKEMPLLNMKFPDHYFCQVV